MGTCVIDGDLPTYFLLKSYVNGILLLILLCLSGLSSKGYYFIYGLFNDAASC